MTFIHRHLVKHILPHPPQLCRSSCSGEESFHWVLLALAIGVQSLDPAPRPGGLILPSSLGWARGGSVPSRHEDLRSPQSPALIITQGSVF